MQQPDKTTSTTFKGDRWEAMTTTPPVGALHSRDAGLQLMRKRIVATDEAGVFEVFFEWQRNY